MRAGHVIVIVLIVVLSGCVTQTQEGTREVKPSSSTAQPTTTTPRQIRDIRPAPGECDRAAGRLRSQLYGMNRCVADSDCTVCLDFRYCDVGCFSLFNRGSDRSGARKAYADLINSCDRACTLICGRPPAREEVGCVAGRCQDLRNLTIQETPAPQAATKVPAPIERGPN